MKNLVFIISLIFSIIFASAGEKVELTTWLKAGPVKMHMPVFSNVKNTEAKTYKPEDLLKDASLLFDQIKVAEGAEVGLSGQTMPWEVFTVPGDSLVLNGADADNMLLLAGYVTIPCWSDLQFRVFTDALCEIYVDHRLEKNKTKNGWDEAGFKIKLDAGKHLILVKLLGTGKSIKFSANMESDNPSGNCPARFDLNPVRYNTIHDVLEGEKISSAQISPSGNFLIIRMNDIRPGTGSSLSDFILKDLRTGKDIMHLRDQRISQVKWLPRTDRFSYSAGIDGKSDLIIYDVVNAVETIVAEGLSNLSDYRWSPGENLIVYSVRSEAPKPGDLKRIYGNDDRIPGFRERSTLHLLVLNSGISVPLTAGNLTASLHDFHPGGTKILFSTSRRDYDEVPFSKQDLYELDLKTFVTDTIWKDKIYDGYCRYSPDGSRLLVSGSPETFGDFGKKVSKGRLANRSDGQLYIFNLSSGKVTPITRDFDPAVNRAHWFSANDIYLSVTEKDYQNLYHYDVNKAKFSKIDINTEVLGAIDYAVSQPLAVYSGSGMADPGRLFLLDLQNRQSTEILFPEKERFDQVRFGRVEEWNFTNKNKTTIYGRVYYPPDFVEGKKYPVIVNYYGGTTPTSRDFGGRYPKDIWAANGYIVYVLQPSGATGFGQEFSALHVNGWGFDAIDDIIEGTKKFLAAHPEADASNVGCIGASYGGFTTMLLQTRTDIFKTAISHAGISSITSYWGEGYWGYSYSAGAATGSYPWNRKDIYVENSPVYNADKFQNSILLLHGTADTNVPVGESLQFYAALKILGKEVEMVLVEGENHHILDYKKRLKWHDTIMAWFAKKLKGQPQQWEDMYPEKNY